MNNKLALLMMIVTNSAYADVQPEQRHEVDYLLDFVKNTSCQINRNGQYHDGKKALAHIQKKYDYFRDKIGTTEQFIEYSATKSTISGKSYLVKCGNQRPQETRNWLLDELKKYRQNSNSQ